MGEKLNLLTWAIRPVFSDWVIYIYIYIYIFHIVLQSIAAKVYIQRISNLHAPTTYKDGLFEWFDLSLYSLMCMITYG